MRQTYQAGIVRQPSRCMNIKRPDGFLQIQRNKAIRQERMKQFVQGKIDRPFLEDHPQADGHDPDYFKHNIVR
jgi:hypothetical protein